MIAMKTPAEVARFVFALTKGNADPEAVAANYRAQAETMCSYAAKAQASRTGKHRGYTAEQCLKNAEESASRAVSVPAELRALQRQTAIAG